MVLHYNDRKLVHTGIRYIYLAQLLLPRPLLICMAYKPLMYRLKSVTVLMDTSKGSQLNVSFRYVASCLTSRKYILYMSAIHLEICNVSFVIFEHLEEIRPYGLSRSQVEHWIM